VTVHCDLCNSIVVNANRRLHFEAVVHHTKFKRSELTYHWELFVVAGATGFVPRCVWLIVLPSFFYVSWVTRQLGNGQLLFWQVPLGVRSVKRGQQSLQSGRF